MRYVLFLRFLSKRLIFSKLKQGNNCQNLTINIPNCIIKIHENMDKKISKIELERITLQV